MTNRYSLRILLLLFLVFLSDRQTFPCHSSGENIAGENIELQVKAAYIYNFTKFVTWNSSDFTPKSGVFTIAVTANDPISDILENFSRKQSNGGGFVVRRFKRKIAELNNCHMIFFSKTDAQQIPSLLKQLSGQQVLTISDAPGFAKHGGIIGFVVENSRVKIEINLSAANRAGLKISAKLLEIARIVNEEN